MAVASQDPLQATPVWLSPVVSQIITYIARSGDLSIHRDPCILWGYTSNSFRNRATLTIFDGLDDTGTLIGNFDISGVYAMSFPGGGLYLRTGLFITTYRGADLTLVSSPGEVMVAHATS